MIITTTPVGVTRIQYSAQEASNIKSCEYNVITRNLEVTFTSGGVYTYKDVAMGDFEHGLNYSGTRPCTKFNQYIRSRYTGTRIG